MSRLDLGHFTVGFVQFGTDQVHLIGSGTLINYGRLNGILTAAHVLDEIRRHDQVGLAQFPTRKIQPQGLRLEVSHIDWVQLGRPPYTRCGPDLAFLKLPSVTASALYANSSFVNFEKQSKSAFAGPPPQTAPNDAVVGAVGEWTEGLFDTELARGTAIGALLNVGQAIPLESAGGFDLIQFRPLPATGSELPQSYGGTSGGGLWRAYTRNDGTGRKVLVELRLLGVAFFQLEEKDHTRDVVCHGPESLYIKLAAQVHDRWGQEIGEDLLGDTARP
jgi:hypothetical protein